MLRRQQRLQHSMTDSDSRFLPTLPSWNSTVIFILLAAPSTEFVPFCVECSVCIWVFPSLWSIIRHSISIDGGCVSVGVFVTGVCGDWEHICCIIREHADVWRHLCAWHLCTISSSNHHRTRQWLYARLLELSGPLYFNPLHPFGCWLPFFLHFSSLLH